jgi:3-hydroxymyristoyl/3-hydroxydecanoyl-(acyl carrier protein) dehydratase
MAAGMVRRHERGRRNAVGLAGLKRVRFRLPIKPDDVLTIALRREAADVRTRYVFDVRVRDEIACTGVLVWELQGVVEKGSR